MDSNQDNLSVAVDADENSDQFIIEFRGPINEDAEPHLNKILANKPNADKCIFRLKNISSINSLGVRTWIKFLRDFGESHKDTKIYFEECAPEIISQINMIPDFNGKAEISSFYADYICDNCDNDKLVLFKCDEIPKPLLDVKCDKCDESMEMEELEEEFFAFLDRKKV